MNRSIGVVSTVALALGAIAGCTDASVDDVAYCVDVHDVRVADDACVGPNPFGLHWAFRTARVGEKVPKLGDSVHSYRLTPNGAAGYGAPTNGGSLVGVTLYRVVAP